MLHLGIFFTFLKFWFFFLQVLLRYNFFNYMFFCFRLYSVFVAAHQLPLVGASGDYALLWCVGFTLQGLPCCRAQALGAWASVVAAHGLSSFSSGAAEHRLRSCGKWAELLHAIFPNQGSSTDVSCIGRQILYH